MLALASDCRGKTEEIKLSRPSCFIQLNRFLPQLPHPTAIFVFLTSPCVFLLTLSFFFLFFSLPSSNSRGDEVAVEQQPSLPLITVVTHGGATAAAACHPSQTLVRQEKDISRCKFSSAVSMGRNRGGDGGGWEEGGQEGGSKEMRWGREGWIEAEEEKIKWRREEKMK